jgi:hypothetical protein
MQTREYLQRAAHHIHHRVLMSRTHLQIDSPDVSAWTWTPDVAASAAMSRATAVSRCPSSGCVRLGFRHDRVLIVPSPRCLTLAPVHRHQATHLVGQASVLALAGRGGRHPRPGPRPAGHPGSETTSASPDVAADPDFADKAADRDPGLSAAAEAPGVPPAAVLLVEERAPLSRPPCPHRLGRRLGGLSVLVRAPSVGSSSYHFEAVAPRGLEIIDSGVAVATPQGSSTSATSA